MRRRFWRLAADVTICGGTELSEIDVTVTKKKGMPMPMMNCGMASDQKSAPLVQLVRSRVDPPSQIRPKLRTKRASILPISSGGKRATNSAAMAVKAVAKPACVAV